MLEWLPLEGTMKIWSDSFADGARIPEKNAFGKHDPKSHIALSQNLSPHIAWDDLPRGTMSLVLVCHDPDVPSRPDDVNKEGRTVPASLKRIDFHHWMLVDIKPDAPPLAEGEFGSGITPRGKSGPHAPRGYRHGINDYTAWFEGDKEMAGKYFGWDGPCPPWNDEIEHHYVFTLYALDVDAAPVQGEFRGPDLRKAIERHTLGSASITGIYAINPKAKPHDGGH